MISGGAEGERISRDAACICTVCALLKPVDTEAIAACATARGAVAGALAMAPSGVTAFFTVAR